MGLLVETGAGVLDANSYGTPAQAREFATLRGYTVSGEDSVLTGFLVRGTEYLQRFDYAGSKRYPGMRYLKFPRVGLVFDDAVISDTEIPPQITNALFQLVVEQTNGVSLASTTVGGKNVKRRKTDVLETEYFEPKTGRFGVARMPAVDAYLAPFLNVNGFGGMLKVTRV